MKASRAEVRARAYRLHLSRARRALRQAERENTRLRNSLAEMLVEEERAALGNWPGADYPRIEHRLCCILAAEMRYGYAQDVHREDLKRIQRARKALGLRWWGGLDYADGLQPGRDQ